MKNAKNRHQEAVGSNPTVGQQFFLCIKDSCYFFNSLKLKSVQCVSLFSFETNMNLLIIYSIYKKIGRQWYLNSRPKDQKVDDKTTELRGFL